MSVAKHMEAMEVWGRLSQMSPEDAKAKAKDEESEMNRTHTSAALSAMVLKSLGMNAASARKAGSLGENEDVVLWTKLFGRSVPKVHWFYLEAKEAKPEQRMRLLTGFAKKVWPLPGAVDDLPKDVARDIGGAA